MRVEIDGKQYVPMPDDKDNQELNALRQEREDAVKLLREICEEHGDNDWADDLHLADVLEKHLYRHLGK
jgi:predicted secreted protein